MADDDKEVVEGDVADEDRISGDEVAARLETIFEEDGEEVGPSAFSPTLSEDPAFQQESELTVSSEELSDEIAPERQPAVAKPFASFRRTLTPTP